jgi:uncharacterized membrane protein
MCLRPSAKQARRENPRRAAADTLLLSASVASLIAVGLVLVRAGHGNGLNEALLAGLSVASIVLAWSVVHTVYSLRYAELYYKARQGVLTSTPRERPVTSTSRISL